MVKLELVEDDANVPLDESQIFEEFSGSDDDYADDFDVNETLGERLAALKDVIPPKYWFRGQRALDNASLWVQRAATFSGKGIWAITSATLLLGVPLSLCIVSEQQLTEMEKGGLLEEPVA